MQRVVESDAEQLIREGSGPLDDLALTLPVFVGYHLGVAFLPLRNAADWVTFELTSLANHDLLAYSGLTLCIGLVFTGVLLVLGRGHSLRGQRFALVVLEGVVYAFAMRVLAGYVVGKLHLSGTPSSALLASPGVFAGTVMSLGAGLYEEIAFRVGLFGLGLRILRAVFGAKGPVLGVVSWVLWALCAALVFSLWHYWGEFGDVFELRSFVFRWVCGFLFTLIYAFRGFAPVVWTHALYDLWVLAM